MTIDYWLSSFTAPKINIQSVDEMLTEADDDSIDELLELKEYIQHHDLS